MSDTINVIANITQIIGFPATVGALLYARIQLKKAATTARVQILLALDERLSEFEDIRVELNTSQLNIEKDEKKIRLRRYIGTFERVGHALRLKEITLKTVDQFYGDRFKNLIKYLIANSAARRIVKNRKGWEDFYHLWEELLGYEANHRKLPTVSRLEDLLIYDALAQARIREPGEPQSKGKPVTESQFISSLAPLRTVRETYKLSPEEWARIIEAFWKAITRVPSASFKPAQQPSDWWDGIAEMHNILAKFLPTMITDDACRVDTDKYVSLLADQHNLPRIVLITSVSLPRLPYRPGSWRNGRQV